SVCSVLNRPERELDNRGESENGQAVIVQPAVEQVHEVEQKLADDLEHSEVHHLGFVMRKLRETMVKFRAGIDFETRAVCLPGLQLKPRHAKRSLDAKQLLVRRSFDIEASTPHADGLGGKRRHERREKLITYGNPLCAANTLLVIRSRSALAETKKASAAAKPTNVDSFCPSINAPDESRVRRIILGLNRRGRSKRHKIACILVRLGPTVFEIDIHFDDVVVFVLRGFFEKELFPNGHLLGRF